jgi:N-acetylmuramoyl-L-alanine amidase
MKYFFLCLFLFSEIATAKVVLIDPGHGGEECGAVGHLGTNRNRQIFEKDLSLRLSIKIKDELSKTTSAYLTRSLDRAVTLQERADLADLVKADLFLSIHFNSSSNAKSHGFELYYLDNNSNVAANKVERSENLNLKGEELIVNQILVDLVVQQTVHHSKELARLVHEKIKPVIKLSKIDDRGVKPGLFYVLALSKRPGLLVEVGFVSNPGELRVVNEEKFMNNLAKAIASGVMNFINQSK